MKKFDLINLIGRILLSFYFVINSLQFFWMTYLAGIENLEIGFWLFVAILELAASIMLLLGIKPRVGAGVLGFFILLKLSISISGLGGSAWEQWEIYHVVPETVGSISAVTTTFPTWASYHVQFLFSKLAIFGACLFMVGTRTIPHSVLARSESNLKQKYGR